MSESGTSKDILIVHTERVLEGISCYSKPKLSCKYNHCGKTYVAIRALSKKNIKGSRSHDRYHSFNSIHSSYTLACKANVLRLAEAASLIRAFRFAASAAMLARALRPLSPPIIFAFALTFAPTLFLAFVDPMGVLGVWTSREACTLAITFDRDMRGLRPMLPLLLATVAAVG